MKKVLLVLLVILLVVALAAAGWFGYRWYRDNHIFVEDAVYPKSAQSLDLRESDISFDHYDQVHQQLPECYILWMVPFQGSKYASDSQSLTVTELTQEDAQILLNYFPALTALDASGCDDYALLSSLQEQMPQCQITYQVDLGGTVCELDTAQLDLQPGDYTYEALLENLTYLTQVSSVTIHTPEETGEELDALEEAYSQITFHYTVEILGQEYATDTRELDLSALTDDQAEETAQKLPLLPQLETVELADSQGVSQLSMEQAKLLMDSAPEAVFHYTFDFYGTTISSTDEEVVIKNQQIGDEGEAQVRLALDLMENCSRFVLDNCRLSDEVMSQIREDYRDKTKVVWRVWFGEGGSSLTDVQVIRAVYGLVDDNCHDLVYCEDVRFMDIGHNEFLDAVDFVAGMPNLEYMILSGSPVKSLEPFSGCKKLKFLEIAFCEYIEDLSPLAGCESLEMLNIGNTHVTDLSPLDDLNLTHLMARLYPGGGSRVPQEEQERFIEQHPDCWSSFTGAQPYGDGWRYEEDNKTFTAAYALINEAFRYPNAPNNVGWYFDETEQETD